MDYPEDLGSLAAVFPHVNWYAEHERFVPVPDSNARKSLHLTVTGLDATLEEYADDLVDLDLRTKQVDDRRVYVQMTPDAGGLIMAIGDDYALSLWGDFTSDELIEVARELKPVCRREWVEAGGKVLDCLPWEPGCVVDGSSLVPPTTTTDSQPTTTSEAPASTTTVLGIPIGDPEFEGAPREVADRLPLPFGGADIETRGAGPTFDCLDHEPGSQECFTNRVEAGLPTE